VAGPRGRTLTDRATDADRVIRDFYRVFARLVGGKVVERDGVIACLGVHPSPIVTNTAWRADPATDPSDVLRIIDGIYGDAGFGGSLLTSSRTDADLDAAAKRSGRHLAEGLPVMAIDAAEPRPASPPIPAGTTARQLDPIADLAVFREILAEGFFEGDPDGRDLVEATFADPGSLVRPDVAVFIAEVAGRPSSVAGAWLLGDDAAIGWVATLPEARRRGLGALVTTMAVDYAFDRGARSAVLQASPSGRSLYARLGFAEVGLDRIWESTRSG
jgi:ribosomal protein S18 acetylase RimI-like enzyme